MRLRIVGTLLACILVAGSAQAGARDGIFNRANGNEPDTLDPQKYELISENNILRDLFEGLTTQGPDNRAVPGQAESWTVSEDGLVWTFKLRQGLKWSDGTPLTADDFVLGARRLADPKTGAKIPDGVFKIANGRDIIEGRKPKEDLGVTAQDPHTVVIRLAIRSPLVPILMWQTVFVPVPSHVYAQHGDAWVKPEHIVTNGAYTLVSWEPSDHVTIRKNPHFRAADTVAIETVRFYPSDDNEMALKRFRAGEIDFVPQLPPAKIDWAKKTVPDALQMTPVLQFRYIAINNRRDVLKDKRLRRALALAMDREIICNQIMRGGCQPAYGIIPRALEGYQGADLDFKDAPQAQRLSEARQLLEEAGYGPSNPLRFELRAMSDAWAKPVATALISMWKTAGVEATLKSSEGRTHFAALTAGDYDAAISGWFGTEDPEEFMWLFQAGGGINDSRYESTAFDAVRRDAEQTMDMAARYKRFADAERILLDDMATIPLFFTVQPVLISPDIKGFAATPRGLTRSRYASFGR
jgi:oligopeptide transport system substrate-binding protein